MGLKASRMVAESVHRETCRECPHYVQLDELTGFRRFRAQVHLFLENPQWSTPAYYFSVFIMFLIVLSIVELCAQTVPAYSDYAVWYGLEVLVGSVFTAELLARVFASRHTVLVFVFEPVTLVDLLAVIPFFVLVAAGRDASDSMRALRIIRLSRVFRLFKIGRYTYALHLLKVTLVKCRDSMGTLFFLFLIVLIVSSSLMYYAEEGTEKDGKKLRSDGSESPFSSIPATFYWCIDVMTTVGVSQMVPVEPFGRVVAAVVSLCGVMTLALPVGVLAVNFQQAHAAFLQIRKKQVSNRTVKLKKMATEVARYRTELTHLFSDIHSSVKTVREDAVLSLCETLILDGLQRLEDLVPGLDPGSAPPPEAAAGDDSSRLAGELERMAGGGMLAAGDALKRSPSPALAAAAPLGRAAPAAPEAVALDDSAEVAELRSLQAAHAAAVENEEAD